MWNLNHFNCKVLCLLSQILMPEFFIRDGGRKAAKASHERKRRNIHADRQEQTRRKRKLDLENEEISSDDEGSVDNERNVEVEDDEEYYEDPQMLEFRKAKKLLAEVQMDEAAGNGEVRDDNVEQRLREEALSHITTRHRRIATSAQLGDSVIQYRAHR
ncbi:hypothetical protein AB6A40_006105 [Gnathostoma spinigerum]|uniref:Uncharacterized protein n=1 Tax=Gnathostoma spinigerum TaxID=75299 RepID=A0ABD6EJG8_9BILA